MKTEINVQPIINGITSKFPYSNPRVFRGRNKKEGHVLIRIQVAPEMELDLDIDIIKSLTEKDYFTNLFDNIHALSEKAHEGRFNACRMGY